QVPPKDLVSNTTWAQLNSPCMDDLDQHERIATAGVCADNPDEALRERMRLVYRANIEAVDAEIGRLLYDSGVVDLENTAIIVIGDNGTVDDAIESTKD